MFSNEKWLDNSFQTKVTLAPLFLKGSLSGKNVKSHSFSSFWILYERLSLPLSLFSLCDPIITTLVFDQISTRGSSTSLDVQTEVRAVSFFVTVLGSRAFTKKVLFNSVLPWPSIRVTIVLSSTVIIMLQIQYYF